MSHYDEGDTINEEQNGHVALLTVQEVARRLRVNEATVRRWIANGVLDALLLPGRGRRKVYRIRQSVLDAIVKHVEQETNG